MHSRPFTLVLPEKQTTSVIFASPHSGRLYTDDFMRKAVLDERAIRSSEDAFVDQLFCAAPEFGAPLISANFPRAYVDLNRAPDEFDPAVIEDVPRNAHNPRINSGLGVIPRVVANGRAIYRGKISLSEAQNRIENVWHPYHTALQDLIDKIKSDFGEAIVVDCHSMPHEAIATVTPKGGHKAEVVLGDRYGAAARHDVVERIEAAFEAVGLRVKRNMPFAGAYITQVYGRPSQGCHVIQVEIDRSLYMNETTVTPNENFVSFRELMTSVSADLAAIGRRDEMTMPLAAE